MKRTTEQVKQAMEQPKKVKDRPVKRQKGIRKGEHR